MRVYVATKFEAKGLARTFYEKLRAAGHVITCDWTNEDDATSVPRECAFADADGVLSADVLVIAPLTECRGAWVEFGIAVARMIPIVVYTVDPRRTWCVFEHLPQVVHVASIEGAVETVNDLQRQRSAYQRRQQP